jgi:serine/threonine protein phosphatase PrpC
MPNNINQDIIDKMCRDKSRESSFQIVLVSGGLSIGKQNKLDRKCEDAFFIAEGSFGVSDGVSGWNDYGFSSNLFSQQLMQNSKDLIEKKLVEIKKEKIEGAVKLSKLDINKKLSRKLSSLSIQ